MAGQSEPKQNKYASAAQLRELAAQLRDLRDMQQWRRIVGNSVTDMNAVHIVSAISKAAKLSGKSEKRAVGDKSVQQEIGAEGESSKLAAMGESGGTTNRAQQGQQHVG